MRVVAGLFAALVGLSVGAGVAFASQLTYRPINPTFGGDPLNGTYLLSSGQAQGHGRAPSSSSTPDLSGLNNAISNLGTSLSAPIIVIPSTPTNP
jgi:curli production assembly/transport component CsgF